MSTISVDVTSREPSGRDLRATARIYASGHEADYTVTHWEGENFAAETRRELSCSCGAEKTATLNYYRGGKDVNVYRNTICESSRSLHDEMEEAAKGRLGV